MLINKSNAADSSRTAVTAFEDKRCKKIVEMITFMYFLPKFKKCTENNPYALKIFPTKPESLIGNVYISRDFD